MEAFLRVETDSFPQRLNGIEEVHLVEVPFSLAVELLSLSFERRLRRVLRFARVLAVAVGGRSLFAIAVLQRLVVAMPIGGGRKRLIGMGDFAEELFE